MLQEFKDFVKRGNVVDMAVGIVVGTAFGLIVKSLVDDVIMPPVGLLVGNIDFSNLFLVLREGTKAGPYPTVAAAKQAGATTLNYGLFFNTIINFLIISFAIFLVVKGLNRLQREKPVDPTTKDCPFCLSPIPLKASRCPFCTSHLTAGTS